MNKLCDCGCDKEVTINQNTKQPNKFINGHNKKQFLQISFEIPKLCSCGCGKNVSSQKVKFRKGHYSRNRPVSIESRNKMSISRTGKKLSKEHIEKLKGRKSWCFGIKHTNEYKQKMSLATKGKTGGNRKGILVSEETKLKMSKTRTGKHHTAETKLKMSISAIDYLEKHKLNGKCFCPRIGDNELPIFDQIENNINEIGISNNRELFLKCGKWPDRYYEKYNLCVDVLEPWHFKPSGELSDNDQTRELIISSRLCCMIYYIPEQEFLTNPDKEIQRFKDFLELLITNQN